MAASDEPVSADDVIASKEMFHEVGGELNSAFEDMGLQAPAAPLGRACERCTCCH